MKHKTTHWVLAAIATIVSFPLNPGRLNADVHSPWILSEHVADTTSLEGFANFPAWKDKQGQERAVAMWKYLCDKKTGVFHFAPIREGSDRRSSELHIVRDPIKMLNSYGYGFCGAFGPTTAGIFEATGLGTARAIGIPGCNHCVTEVWYDGDWHYFDVDLRGVLFQRDGRTIASVEDVIREPDLWTNTAHKIQPFFTNDHDLSVYARGYAAEPVDHLYRWFMHGSTMDYRLRQGETFTRWWRPQGGRWSYQEEDTPNEWWKDLIRQEPYGAKSNHANFSVWTHGNGLFEYKPVLRIGSRDFEDGVFDQKNVVLTDHGLTLAGRRAGEVIFEVLSPYVIVPKVGDLGTRDDDCDASLVTFKSRGHVQVSISLDYGRSWTPLETVSEEQQTTLDLTPYLRERYQYLIKFTLTGEPHNVAIDSLSVRTWVQVAPASLPQLQQGVNHLRLKMGDKHGLATTPWMQTPNMANRDEMSRYWTRQPEDYAPDRFQQRVKGEMELLFAAPPGRQIEWMSLGGFFGAYLRDAAPRTKNEIWYAAGTTGQWKRVYQANVPTWNNHWHYAFDQEIMLDAPLDTVRVRYVGAPGVNGVRVNLHSARQRAAPSQAIIVTHGYKMDGKLLRRRFRFDRPTEYTLTCPQTPENVFIQLVALSDFAARTSGAVSDDERADRTVVEDGLSRRNPQAPP